MKKSLSSFAKKIAPFAIAGIMMTACKKDEVPNPNPNPNPTPTPTAQVISKTQDNAKLIIAGADTAEVSSAYPYSVKAFNNKGVEVSNNNKSMSTQATAGTQNISESVEVPGYDSLAANPTTGKVDTFRFAKKIVNAVKNLVIKEKVTDPDAATKTFILNTLNTVTPNTNGSIEGIYRAIGEYSGSDNVNLISVVQNGTTYYGLQANGVNVMADEFGKLYATLIELAKKYDPKWQAKMAQAGTPQTYLFTGKGVGYSDYDQPLYFKQGIVKIIAKLLSNNEYKDNAKITDEFLLWVKANNAANWVGANGL